MRFERTALEGVRLIYLEPRGDARGAFARTFCARTFAAEGLKIFYPQQNASVSAKAGTLRGMHRQRGEHAEAKLIRCLRGAIYDVLIDLRPESPTYRRWEAYELAAGDARMLYAPPGLAHGFQTLRDDTEVSYLVSAEYAPEAEAGVRHDDPAFAVVWPLPVSVISPKDQAWPDFTG